jgi:16S rRNA (guanine527-N7)-methyltransferase
MHSYFEHLQSTGRGVAVDNKARIERLQEGATKLGAILTHDQASAFIRLGEELLRWNAKVNLTAITDWNEVLEKHFLDSLAPLPELADAKSLLDLGAGAGFPGLPLALVRPELEVTLVDAVAKKIGFIKHVAASFGLAPRVKGMHQRAQGQPEAEKLPLADRVISRALMDLPAWAQLAREYLRPGGKVVAMLGRPPNDEEVEAVATASGLRCESFRKYVLPFSKDPRALVVLVRP